MPKFGTASLQRLSQLHPDLQKILNIAIQRIDFTVACGFRGKEEQNKAVAEHKSKTPWPTSKHNHTPSLAVDIVPCVKGVPMWTGKDAAKSFGYLIGYCIGIADSLGIKVRGGIDWDKDGDLTDQDFNDLPHLELEEVA